MIRLIFSVVLMVSFCISMKGQSIQLLTDKPGVSIRGLSVVDDKILWVSGSKGTVGKSIDGGAHWEWFSVKGFEQNDFRDIEAFDASTAVIMAVAAPAFILKTIDGGINWQTVYTDTTKGMFLDAMDFLPNGYGMVVCDPIDGKMYTAVSNDFGTTWERKQMQGALGNPLKTGESMFASSGTNIRLLPNRNAVVVTGGMSAGLLMQHKYVPLPIIQGKQTTGANSIAVFAKGKSIKMVIVGGDFQNDTSKDSNCVLVDVKKNSFISPNTPPAGYRSCVEYINANTLITCGTSGVDISTNSGNNWQMISKESYHVCRKAKVGNAVFLAGAKGKIAVYYPSK
jgi:hypothetical protein